MNQIFKRLRVSLLLILFCAGIPGLTVSVSAQSKTVTGTVRDVGGETLPGVSVVVKGTATGTTTNFDGNYSISIPDGQTVLEFSFVGFENQDVSVSSQTVINVAMKQDTKLLDEVVVVGYGVMRKSDVTGAVGKIGAADILEVPAFNALQGMRGKISGVNVYTNSGAPSGSNRVVIRGVGTINSSSNPLYIVDGVAMLDFQFLNPNDIESMEVLKDASSTAIYGARGANGVILVTTKRGNKEDKVTVSYDGYMSVGWLRKKMDLLNSNQFMEVMKRGFENAPLYKDYDPVNDPAPVFTANDKRLFDANGNPLYDTDWQKETTRTAISHNHQLSIQQGGKNSSTGAFLNYTDNQGIMLNSYMKRVNAKIAYDVKPKDWLSFGTNLLVNRTWENEVAEGGGGLDPRRTMIEMPPIFPVKFPNGEYSSGIDVADKYGFEAMANPVHVLKTQERLRDRTQIFGNAALTFHILPGLDLKTQFGVDNQFRNDKEYSPTDLQNISFTDGGIASIFNSQNMYWQEETFLSYNNVFGKHRINSVLGLSWQENTYQENKGETKGFADDFFKYNNMETGKNPQAPKSKSERWAMNSYFLRAGYTFNDRYLATVTARIDGSSKFGKNNKYAFFPSLGLGWIISNEKFFSENLKFVNQLKLRTSYGSTGNSEIGLYRSLATISSGTVLINGDRQPAAWATRLGNPSLKWEKTNQFDIGFNLDMFNRRVTLEFDYYYKLTKDLLLDRPIPHSTGFKTVMDNIGEVSNRGIDVLLTTRNIETADFSWESTVNLNFNKNKIESLGENDEDILPGPIWVSGSQTVLRVGESLGSFYGYTRYGTWGTQEIAAMPDFDESGKKVVKPVAGTAKRSAEKSILGKGLPDWTGSFINKFSYKNFDFILDLQFVFGGDILQQYFHSTTDRTGYGSGLAETLTEAWTPTNQNTMVQQVRNGPMSGQSSEVDSYWVSDGSYLRINGITFGYTFGEKMLKKTGINRLRVYATVNNAWVFHSKDFKSFDPEGTSHNYDPKSSGGSQWGQNMFFFQYPRPTTLTFGLNLSF